MKLNNFIFIVFLIFLFSCNNERTKNTEKGLARNNNSTPQTNSDSSKTNKVSLNDTITDLPLVCRYDPSVSTLEGFIIPKTFWGPPNYGDDTLKDSKEKVFILELRQPIKIIAARDDELNETRDTIKQIQLISGKNMATLSRPGKTCIVKGSLFTAQTGHHHTEVIMQVTDIR